MKKRIFTALLALSVPGAALAAPHKLLVLQSEGRADAATRAKIDAAVLKLATAAEPGASAGELNFSDAATAVGCNPDTPACKDEVIGMLSVDEIVITKLAPRPGGLEVTVHRIRKGGASRDASMVIPAGEPPDKLDGIAPVFGGRAAAPAPAARTARGTRGGDEQPNVIPSASASAATPSRSAHDAEQPAVIGPSAGAPEPQPSALATPPGPAPLGAPVDDPHPGRRRLEIAGMAGGAGMVVLGFVLWGAARGVQDDIDNAPTRTQQDLAKLRDLESKGDAYAGLGNVLTIGGLVVGGVATYYYFRDRRAASTATALLAPTVFDHGAGLVLTIGGSP